MSAFLVSYDLSLNKRTRKHSLMNYERFIEVLQHQLESVVPLMPAQIRRIILLCRSIFLTSRIHLSFMARCLPMTTQQDSRIRVRWSIKT